MLQQSRGFLGDNALKLMLYFTYLLTYLSVTSIVFAIPSHSIIYVSFNSCLTARRSRLSDTALCRMQRRACRQISYTIYCADEHLHGLTDEE